SRRAPGLAALTLKVNDDFVTMTFVRPATMARPTRGIDLGETPDMILHRPSLLHFVQDNHMLGQPLASAEVFARTCTVSLYDHTHYSLRRLGHPAVAALAQEFSQTVRSAG
ncbi:MAG: hypothetical protein ACYCZ6_12800, partial [Polaromonas sp.]